MIRLTNKVKSKRETEIVTFYSAICPYCKTKNIHYPRKGIIDTKCPHYDDWNKGIFTFRIDEQHYLGNQRVD